MRGAHSSRGRGAPRRRWRPDQRGGCSGGFTCGRGSRGTCVPQSCRPCRRPRSGGSMRGRRRGRGGGRRARTGCKWRKGWSAGCRPGASAGRFCWRRRAREEGAGVAAVLSCRFCRWRGSKEGTETGRAGSRSTSPPRLAVPLPTSANKGARKYITPWYGYAHPQLCELMLCSSGHTLEKHFTRLVVPAHSPHRCSCSAPAHRNNEVWMGGNRCRY